MPKNKRWGIWVLSQKSWMENNKRKKALYSKKSNAKKDCDSFNNMWKGRTNTYEVREVQ